MKQAGGAEAGPEEGAGAKGARARADTEGGVAAAGLGAGGGPTSKNARGSGADPGSLGRIMISSWAGVSGVGKASGHTHSHNFIIYPNHKASQIPEEKVHQLYKPNTLFACKGEWG